MLSNIANRPLNKTGNLISKLKLKRHSQVMLNTNVDVNDILITGQLGYTNDFATIEDNVTKIYTNFVDARATFKAIPRELLTRAQNTIPVIRTEASFVLSKSQTCTIKQTQLPIILA